MTEFHNPYHFVPVPVPKAKDWASRDDFKRMKQGERKPGNTAAHADHGLYQTGEDVFHGRLVCRLTTETPTFIGARRYREASDDAPAEVAPFELDGQPAIPASTLRGLISSVAEAASGSALRVLEDRVLSFRKPIEESLSAIGVVVRRGDQTLLRPLTLPVARRPEGGTFSVPEPYRPYYVGVPLKILVGNYRNDDRSVRIDWQACSFDRLARNPVLHRTFYYAKLAEPTWDEIEREKAAEQRAKRNGERQFSSRFRFGWDGRSREDLLLYQKGRNLEFHSETYLNQQGLDKAGFIRGIFRIMGGPDRELPATVKHETFVPYPDLPDWSRYELAIAPRVVSNFERLAAERAEADHSLPYRLWNVDRNRAAESEDSGSRRLEDGDLVFFRLDDSGQVAEISYASNWRGSPTVGEDIATVHRFFEQSGSAPGNPQHEYGKELLPFHKNRQRISPAELVFGFVEERKKDDKDDTPVLAYAGRVRFSNALLDCASANPKNAEPYLPEVTLKILDSPKPPSPALYFREKKRQGTESGYIAKQRLNPGDHQPQGRKFYLHHRAKELQQTVRPWQTHPRNAQESLLQKTRITPLRSKLIFTFHIDFHNLNAQELGMLCYALQPCESFQHKLGMGKPIGLGSVSIQPLGLFVIDRKTRYEEPFSSNRYSGFCLAEGIAIEKLPERYRLERRVSATATAAEYGSLRNQFREKAKRDFPDVISSLERLGDPRSLLASVHYPQINSVNGQALLEHEQELEHYRWWVANDKGTHTKRKGSDGRPLKSLTPKCQPLTPLDEGDSLPTLTAHEYLE